MTGTAEHGNGKESFDIAGWLSITITGLANFSTQYNFQSIAVALMIMSTSVCTSSESNCTEGVQATWVESFPSAAVFLGAIVGQLSMGYLGDYMSRSYALAVTMLITSLSAMMTAASSDGSKSATDIYASIVFFRFTLGIGAGGVYPLTATKASEDASHTKGKINSKAASWSFFWQMPGLVCPWLIGYLATFNNNLSTNGKWRLVLGIGAIPPFLCILLLLYEHQLFQRRKLNYEFQHRSSIAADKNSASVLNGIQSFRLTTSDNSASGLAAGITTGNKTSGNGKNPETHKSGHSISFGEVIRLIRQDPRIRNRLIICGSTWFLYNIIVYGLGLLAGNLIFSFNDDDNISANSSIRNISGMQMTALSLSTPATLISIAILPYTGLKALQVIGFSLICICMFFLAVFFYPLQDANEPQQLFALYCISSMSLNIGAGITTYALPAALFPKKIRSTFNGLAAAIGKLGAFCGAFSFHAIADEVGYSWVTGMCSFVALIGAIVTVLFIDSNDISTEDTRESDRMLHLVQSMQAGEGATNATPASSQPQVQNPMLEEDDDDYEANDQNTSPDKKLSSNGKIATAGTPSKDTAVNSGKITSTGNTNGVSSTSNSKYKLNAGFIMDTDDENDASFSKSTSSILNLSSSSAPFNPSLANNENNSMFQGDDDL